MARWPQRNKELGSQKWLQSLVNDYQALINREIAIALGLPAGEIRWLSPLFDDEYAEYQDGDAFAKLGVVFGKTRLGQFWPARGPCWDALAIAGQSPGKPILVEAKSHLGELCSTKCGATRESLDRINGSLKLTREFLGSKTRIDWSKSYYQYANRLAHLYLLRELNGLDAYMVFLYFLNDEEMGGPRTVDEWKTVIELAQRSLGVCGHPFLKYAPSLFIDVSQLQGP